MEMDEVEAEATAGREVLVPAESQAPDFLSRRPPAPAAVNDAAANSEVSGEDEATARQPVLSNDVSQRDDSVAEQPQDLGKQVDQSHIYRSQSPGEPVDKGKEGEMCEPGFQPKKTTASWDCATRSHGRRTQAAAPLQRGDTQKGSLPTETTNTS